MNKQVSTLLLVSGLVGGMFSCHQEDKSTEEIIPQKGTTKLRAPAYPLVTIDPYTSAWSMADHLYDDPVRHWTGKIHSLIGAIKVDNALYRFMGKEEIPLKPVLSMGKDEPWTAQYTNTKPAAGWETPAFNADSWKSDIAPFGSEGMNTVRTVWDTENIWVRRTFTLPESQGSGKLFLVYSHDDDFELYLNGQQIVNTGNSAQTNVSLELDPALLKTDGENILAAHCRDRQGLAYVDFGIYQQIDQKPLFPNTATQESVKLSATQTYYTFTAGPVKLELTFTSPLLPDNLDLLSRPVNYITYAVSSTDKAEHEVALYFEMTPEWAVNEPGQEVEALQGQAGAIQYLKAGTTEQPVLQKQGDNVRIDWGYVYLATAPKTHGKLTLGNYFSAKKAFSENGSAGEGLEKITVKMTDEMPALTYIDALTKVDAEPSAGYFMIAYDDKESIQYFENNLPAWWTNGGTVTIDQALQMAATDHIAIRKQCADFDEALWNEAEAAGGKNYADLCVLAFRQSIAAHKLTKDPKTGDILFLSKENFSNGSIGTVDVTYPSAPLFLRYNPDLLKGMLNPIFYYSESGQWTKPFAAHDVGTYPKANGQTYGGDMPVEESGNMIILTAAIAHQEGNAQYAEKHWDVLTTWANYLLENGLDPENQLCTDDFAGHFAHNTNLSVKAIMGIASYGMLADMLGKKDIATKYSGEAKRMANEWEKMANDGDHYKLTFDKSGTWSQKYNMVWDKLLGYNMFPKEIVEKEIAWYLSHQNKYGLPLDNRRTYTKSDWIVWTATLADDKATFEKFINPVHDFVTETPSRVPMTDWYETPDAKQVGFQARSVVGGYFIKMLDPKK